MKGAKITRSLILILIAIMCISFSSYVILSAFNVNSEVAASDLSEEDTKAAEEYPKELVALLEAPSYAASLLIEDIKNESRYERVELPVFYIAPNTPPPDLG